MTRFILKGTFLVELLGALALLPVFCRDYGLRGVWTVSYTHLDVYKRQDRGYLEEAA